MLYLDMRLSRVKGVWWGGAEDWEAADGDDEVESGELGARPPFNFATLERVSYNIHIWYNPPAFG